MLAKIRLRVCFRQEDLKYGGRARRTLEQLLDFTDSLSLARAYQAPLFDKYFLKGSIHHILINREVITESDVRYSTPGTDFTVSRSSTEVLSFREQYYVNVISSFGTAKGSGWYDANTTTLVEGPPHLNANRYVNLLGVRFTQIGWLTQEGRIMPNGETKVDHPMTLTALYILTYQPWVIGVLLPVGSLLLIIVRSRKSRNSESKKLDNLSNSVERKAV